MIMKRPIGKFIACQKSGPLNSYEKGHDCNIVRPFLGHFAAHPAMLLLGALAWLDQERRFQF